MSTCNFFVRRYFLFFVMSSFAISQQSLYGMDRDSDEIKYSHSASHHLSAVSIDGDNVEEFLRSTSNRESLARVQSLTLTGSWEGKGKDNIFHALLLPLKGLRTLNVEISSLSKNDAVILSVLMPRELNELNVKSPEFPKSFFEYVPQQLDSCSIFTPKSVKVLSSKSFGSLKELRLFFEGRSHYANWELDAFLENPPKELNVLKICGFDWTFKDSLVKFLSKLKVGLPNLTHLIISRIPGFHVSYESDKINHLGEFCKGLPASLEYLEFSNEVPASYRGNATPATPFLDLSHLTHLRVLNLDGWILKQDFNITFNNAVQISTLPSNHPLILRILQGKELSQIDIRSLTLGQLSRISSYIYRNGKMYPYHGETLRNLAIIQSEGSPISNSLSQSLSLYEMANERGFPTADEVLGAMCFELATLVKIEYPIKNSRRRDKIEHLRKGVKYKNDEARYALALMYRNGEVPEDPFTEDKRKDEEIALDLFLPLAEKGNSKAQHNVGNLYFKLKDYENAKKWFQKSDLEASKRNLEKIINLGH